MSAIESLRKESLRKFWSRIVRREGGEVWKGILLLSGGGGEGESERREPHCNALVRWCVCGKEKMHS